jgi:hypothetical protein
LFETNIKIIIWEFFSFVGANSFFRGIHQIFKKKMGKIFWLLFDVEKKYLTCFWQIESSLSL